MTERVDEYMARIQRVFDEHMDMLEKMMEDESIDEDEIVHDMVLAEYNFEQLSILYELSPDDFCEAVGDTMEMEDIDIWLDLLMKGLE